MKKYSLDIVIAASGLPFNGSTIPSGQSLGGSETAAIQAAEALGALGHKVVLYCNTPDNQPDHKNNVYFAPMGWVAAPGGGNFPKGFFDYVRATPHDVLIVQRLPLLFQFDTKAKVHLLWQHDLATKTGPSQFAQWAWNIDRILVPSVFMREQYKKIHGGTDDLYHVTRNGIDHALFSNLNEAERDRFRLTYTSRPERGLDILIRAVFPKILQKEPRAKLYVSRYQDPQTLDLYRSLEGEMKSFGDRIEILGNLGKKDLYENYRRSRVYIYPSEFEEISMITAIEASQCGAVFLGPWRAALPETLGGAGVLVRDDGSIGLQGDATENGFKRPTDTFIDGIVREALRLMHDDDYFRAKQKLGLQRAAGWGWKPVVEDWVELSHELIAQRSADPRRMLKHFLVNSDVVAAQKFADAHTEMPELKQSVNKYIDKFVPFVNQTDSHEQRKEIAAFYEARSGGDRADYRTAFYANTEVRLQALLAWMKPKVESGEIKTVLDFGCAHGGYAKVIVETFPTVSVVGTDVSASLIRCANELRATMKPEDLKRAWFFQADEDTDLHLFTESVYAYAGKNTYEQIALNGLNDDTKDGFDLIVAMEVLEHLPNSEEVATKLERLCKPDGWMVFTVPHGHRERDEHIMKGVPPVHVRSFDMHDIRDLFSHRKNYSAVTFSDLQELEYDKTFAGWWMISYRKDQFKVGEIDYERKFFLQGPRETLAVCMIVNNTEEIMHRCLRGVARYADQIVIVDNGPSTDRTVEFALEYTHDVRAGTSPFWCYKHFQIHPHDQIIPGECEMAGFETPRNESIDGVWTDHILWIDDDESLIDGANVPKYLRPNILHGYAVSQRHVGADVSKTDIPVRLYRNKSNVKFYGLVHEHAELGINRGMGDFTVMCPDFFLYHDAYLTEGIRRERFKRNIKLLECDRLRYPDRLLGIFLYEIRDSIHFAHYELERNNRHLTPEVEKYCRRCVDAYRKHFLGKSLFFDQDGLNYYSEAMTILGEGIEIAYAVDAKQMNAQIPPPLKFRASDIEEAKKIIGTKLEQAAWMATGPYLA